MKQPSLGSRADHVIGVFTREHLSGALSAVHRSGFGHHVRVFDGARHPAGAQLLRAGLRLVDAASVEPDELMVVVTAPGRTAMVAEMFYQTLAERVILAERALPVLSDESPDAHISRATSEQRSPTDS